MKAMLAFTRTPYNDYEVRNAETKAMKVYAKLGHALHHMESGHETKIGCCPAVDCNGNVVLPQYR